MELITALQLVNDIVTRKTGRVLREPETVLFEGAWLGLTYEQIAESSEYSTNYLMRDVGPRFWRLLSDALEESVSKTNIRTVLERVDPSDPATAKIAPAPREASSTPKSSPVSSTLVPKPTRSALQPVPAWTEYREMGDAPKTALLHDRTNELATLTRWITEEQCRLIGVWGISGVGKTTLVRTLVDQVYGQFDGVIWQSLHQAPTLSVLMEALPDMGTTPEIKGDRIPPLLTKLQTQSYLWILDGVETILQAGQTAGHYREGYENYAALFQSISDHAYRSCVVVVGLEPPREFARLESETATVRSLVLSGLAEPDAERILAEERLVRSPQWSTLVEYYQGHPTALRMASRIIRNLFGGSVVEFLKQQSFIFDDINALLEKSFSRLSIVEQEVLYWLASEGKPTTLHTIRQLIPLSLYSTELLEALNSLKQRSLLEITHAGDQAFFTLQPLIRDYVINQFIAQVLGSSVPQERYQRWPLRSTGYTLELSPSAPKTVQLGEWLHQRFDADWQPVEFLFTHPGQSPQRLRSALYLRGENIIKRFKPIPLTPPPLSNLVVLLVAINQEPAGTVNICVQVQPNREEFVLPPHLKLNLVDPAGNTLATVESQEEDNFIQLPYFRGMPQECFNIQLRLNAASHTEKFMI